MRNAAVAASLLTFALAGCTEGRGPRIGETGDGGTGGPFVDSGTQIVPYDGGWGGDDCRDEASDYIYLVTSDNRMLRYKPDMNLLEPLGPIACPSGGSTPFSMAVDRDAQAWVVHQDGRIYKVNLLDPGLACTATSFAPFQNGFDVFGMGFSAPEGSDFETLFVAGHGRNTLAKIDTTSLLLSTVGSINGSPELTGTGNGELWGFAPDSFPSSTVVRFDPANGATLRTINADPATGGSGSGSAWAFAFWGGYFYIFFESHSQTSTHIWRLDLDTETLSDIKPDSGYRIVGAGVSTCAPTLPI